MRKVIVLKKLEASRQSLFHEVNVGKLGHH